MATRNDKVTTIVVFACMRTVAEILAASYNSYCAYRILTRSRALEQNLTS